MSSLNDNPGDIQFWLNGTTQEEIAFAGYWNNEEIEKEKDWYILNGNSNKLTDYLTRKTTYHDEFRSIVTFMETNGLRLKGVGVDIAAGVCWTTALLSRIEGVDTLYALDISRHRLEKIAPRVFDLFGAKQEKIVRVLGSFYDIRLPDASVDFCFMSQAFHHADNPDLLLSEVRRILKSRGLILMIGEQPVKGRAILKRYVKNSVSSCLSRGMVPGRPRLLPTFQELFPPDTESGDHYYRLRDYVNMFARHRFMLRQVVEPNFRTFIAVKER
jgi:ubiquinone/menaquinone biosynthesis C-methylase UbiE